MKYILFIIIILLGGLLFINRDRFLSMNTDSNTAAVVNATIPRCGEGGSYINKQGLCYCPQRKSVISWYSVCSLGNATTTSTTLYELKALRLLGAANKTKSNDNGPIIRTSFTGKGSVTGAGKYNKGAMATLTAIPDKNSKVIWSNMCSGSNNTCNVSMNSDKEVYYAFVPKGNSIRDIFKKCTLVPFYNPLTKTVEVTMSCDW